MCCSSARSPPQTQTHPPTSACLRNTEHTLPRVVMPGAVLQGTVDAGKRLTYVSEAASRVQQVTLTAHLSLTPRVNPPFYPGI